MISKLKWDVAGVTAHDFLPLLTSRLPLGGVVDTDMVTRHAQTFIALAARGTEFVLKLIGNYTIRMCSFIVYKFQFDVYIQSGVNRNNNKPC